MKYVEILCVSELFFKLLSSVVCDAILWYGLAGIEVKTREAKLNGSWLILIILVPLNTWVELGITRFIFSLSFN